MGSQKSSAFTKSPRGIRSAEVEWHLTHIISFDMDFPIDRALNRGIVYYTANL